MIAQQPSASKLLESGNLLHQNEGQSWRRILDSKIRSCTMDIGVFLQFSILTKHVEIPWLAQWQNMFV